MSATIILILRILLTVCLYLFLFLLVFQLWCGLKEKIKTINAEDHLQILLKFTDSEITKNYTQSDITIGRGDSTDFQIDEETVSSIHARIFYKEKNWLIEDLNSTNGTYINKQRILSPTILVDKDLVNCGKASIEIIIPDKKTP